MQDLSHEKLDVAIPALDRRDEIGLMAPAVQTFRPGLLEAKHLAEEKEADRTLRLHRQDAMDHHTAEFGGSVARVMSTLADAAERMRAAAARMTETAEQVEAQAAGTAQQADGSSRDLASVVAATEQLTASIGEITRQVATAAEVAQRAVGQSERTEGVMRSLTDAAERVSNVVHLIAGIAGQT